MCGGGGQVQDNSHHVAQIQADAAREAREAEAARAEQQRLAFEQRMSDAYAGAMGSANQFFVNQGVDANDYQNYITDAANKARGMVPTGAENIGSFFDSVGQSAYDTATKSKQNKFTRDIDSFAPTGFYNTAIGDNAYAEAKAAALAEQRAAAEAQANNLFKRGIFTDRGLQGALSDLDSQTGKAKRTLREIGGSLVSQGRGTLKDIIAEARQGASSAKLGGNFDPFSYQQRINEETENFFSSLAENFNSYVPSDLFDTTGLTLTAGRAQGVQNTPFDPKALAGIFGEEDEDDGMGGMLNPFGASQQQQQRQGQQVSLM